MREPDSPQSSERARSTVASHNFFSSYARSFVRGKAGGGRSCFSQARRWWLLQGRVTRLALTVVLRWPLKAKAGHEAEPHHRLRCGRRRPPTSSRPRRLASPLVLLTPSGSGGFGSNPDPKPKAQLGSRPSGVRHCCVAQAQPQLHPRTTKHTTSLRGGGSRNACLPGVDLLGQVYTLINILPFYNVACWYPEGCVISCFSAELSNSRCHFQLQLLIL